MTNYYRISDHPVWLLVLSASLPVAGLGYLGAVPFPIAILGGLVCQCAGLCLGMYEVGRAYQNI